MAFHFVIKHFSFLKNIPVLPHIFDGLLLLSLYLSNRAILDVMDDLALEIKSWPGIRTRFHKYGGRKFDYDRYEIGHIHSNGLIDILFDKKTSDDLINQGKAEPHHTLKNTGWVSFYIKSPADYANAVNLFKMSYAGKSKKKCNLGRPDQPPQIIFTGR